MLSLNWAPNPGYTQSSSPEAGRPLATKGWLVLAQQAASRVPVANYLWVSQPSPYIIMSYVQSAEEMGMSKTWSSVLCHCFRAAPSLAKIIFHI